MKLVVVKMGILPNKKHLNEFLLAYKFLITTGVEVLAAVTGLLFFKKYKPTAANFFFFGVFNFV